MSTRDGYTDGTFSWVDLMSPDVEASKAFYAGLFGWSSEDQATDDQGGAYTLLRSGGSMVAGLGAQSEEMRAAGVPALWNSYVQVADVDATLTKVTELGGSIVMPATQVMEAGRMGIFAAPDSAVLSVWQPRMHKGAQLVNEPVSLGWNELITDDPAGAETFYAALFGWTFVDGQDGAPGYRLIVNGENMNGGILTKRPEMSAMPNLWQVYFVVANCDATMKKAAALGGQAITEAMDVPGVGRFAVCMDAHGGMFEVIQMSAPERVAMG